MDEAYKEVEDMKVFIAHAWLSTGMISLQGSFLTPNFIGRTNVSPESVLRSAVSAAPPFFPSRCLAVRGF
jgi:hypothetical protein